MSIRRSNEEENKNSANNSQARTRRIVLIKQLQNARFAHALADNLLSTNYSLNMSP